MNANKLQTKILAVLLIVSLLCCGFFLVGCKKGNENTDDKESGTSQNSAINLTEAKELIVNALALNSATSSNQQDNRDIFEKFGKVQLNLQTERKNYSTNQITLQEEYEGYYEYSNSTIQKYLANMASTTLEGVETTEENYQEYSSDYVTIYKNIEDDFFGNVVTTTTLPNNETGGETVEFITIESEILSITDIMFTDGAFNTIYEEDVEKIERENGYSLTLLSSYKGYYRLTCWEELTDDQFNALWNLNSAYDNTPQGLKDEEKFEIVLNFDEIDNITSIEIALVYREEDWDTSSENLNTIYYKQTKNINISMYDGEIVQPQWLTDYLANKES